MRKHDQTTTEQGNTAPTNTPRYRALDKWRGRMGRSRATVHRWRKDGILPERFIRNFYGKLYISEEGEAHMDALIESGGMAKPAHGAAAKWTTQLADIAKEDTDNGECAAADLFKALPHNEDVEEPTGGDAPPPCVHDDPPAKPTCTAQEVGK